MDIGEYVKKIALIKRLQTNEEKAKAIRIVLNDVLKAVFSKVYKQEIKKKEISLLELIDSRIVNNYINDNQVIESLHFIRIIGITAEHGEKIRDKDAKVALENLEHLIRFIEAKNNNKIINKPDYYTEAETRKQYIDLYLREAGWDILKEEGVSYPGKAGIEIEVDGMPNASGIGFCDYILYDMSGKPLAVVEAKKTSIDKNQGRHQADLYAESLKAKFGYKPIIYCTNGYETVIIDGFYQDRPVAAFHTMKELERMIQRRNRGDISDITNIDNIAARPYQQIALSKLCERFNDRNMRGLITMATGTGKTRVAIALTDILSRNGWIKNVLFLADRTALVKQAKQNFAKLLPNMTICELSDGNSIERDMNARIMLSTYQTMINYIDAEDKEFSSGRFDLIIVDEAHRSIFNRYSSIFAYFDSLLVGFTATPRNEVIKNTYDIFKCESGEPTYDYPLEDAISDHYLVGYQVINRHSRIMERGIHQEELSDDQIELLDDYNEGDEETPDLNIPANAIFRTIFNEDTCRNVISDLMDNGLYVEEGETIGKTIIFAYNHKHAQMIVDEFRNMYPKYPANTCQLIDYSVKYADDLVEKFKEDDEFRIAVSVDMLDTGIDVPSVLNLVFFKPIKSKIKFVQMIGRGTRLCEDIFGPGKNKSKFNIFDYCNNFEYFQIEHKDAPSNEKGYSLSQRLFALRTEIAYNLQDYKSQNNPFLKNYYNETVNALHGQVKELKANSNRISVRQNMKYVDKFSDSKNWLAITPVGVQELKRFIAPIIDGNAFTDYRSLVFDIRMLRIQKGFCKKPYSVANSDIKKVREIAQYLLNYKCSLPQVIEKAEDLKELVNPDTWDTSSSEDGIENLERLRLSVRDLMKYISKEDLREYNPIDLDVTDELTDPDFRPEDTFVDIRTYREKVIDYLVKNGDDETIEKIRNLEQLDKKDVEKLKQLLWYDLGSEEEYNKESNGKDLAVFIRSLIGINQDIVNERFSEYLANHKLNSKQMEFLQILVKYAQKNGDIELPNLMEDEPFKSVNWNDLFYNNIGAIKFTVSLLHDPIVIA